MFSYMKKLKKSIDEHRIAPLLNGAFFSCIPIVLFYLMEFYEHNPFEEVRSSAQTLNIILFELIAWMIFVLVGSARVASGIIIVGAMLFGLINHYVMEFRSTPFVPWDILSVKTAGSVAGNYDFTPGTRVIIVSVIFVILFIRAMFWKFKIDIKIYFRLIPTVILIVCLSLFVNALQNEDFQAEHRLYPFLFTPVYMTNVNGMAVTFAMDLAYMAVDKPSGYSRDNAREILESYAKDVNSADDKAEGQKKPNIIVVMDEAFSDLSILGDFKVNQDYMPFIRSLQMGYENTISGNLNVSVCGGNTANSEFEFLTGNTMAFLPNGSIPYQQYIKSEIPSFAGYLSSLGYKTFAQHPYYESGWNRNAVYPELGFDEMNFIGDYHGIEFVRKYVSDKTSFQKIKETYEKNKEQGPLFIFNVTMQNHGGYNDLYDNFQNTVNAGEIGSGVLDQYLSLIKITDYDVQSLINYFENVDDDTVIVFFGDHQPADAVASYVLKDNGIDSRNLTTEQQELRYQVPYFIWANYDIREAEGVDTSLNYLAANVLKEAGVATDEYYDFLLELEQNYPILSAVRTEKNENLEEAMLEKYKKVQYYRLFDWKGEE